ncbi:glycosyltransferase family 32 protein [Trametopsis cervina]|nr:glycosyltransferase family 32 protein [Trametopsis cervina]
MASSIYLGRTNGLVEKSHNGNALPTYNSAVMEKRHRHSHSQAGGWLTPVSVPIPGVRTRRLRFMLPNLPRLHQSSVHRFGRRRGPAILTIGFVLLFYIVFALHRRFGTDDQSWPTPFPDPSTLVYRREDLQKIWEWEVSAGHYPSSRRIPTPIGLRQSLQNPALPANRSASVPSRFRGPIATDTDGIGPKRVYLDLTNRPPNVAYPPRPVPGSVADLDIIMEHCDFSENKYVRDCLEVLRHGGGLDLGARVRRGNMDKWKYIYLEDSAPNVTDSPASVKPFLLKAAGEIDPARDLPKKRGVEWEPHLDLSPPIQYVPYKDQSNVCSEDNPRIYHMFWTGPFTDKPYLALMSFLYTQNLGLHHDDEHPDPKVCRPKFWLWINPGPAASIPNPSAVRDMYEQLKSSPWASPFLHPRFKDVIQFKLWNTTEQLDGIPELKDEWRALRDSLFNSGGYVEKVPQQKEEVKDEAKTESADDDEGDDGAVAAPVPSPTKGKDTDDKVNRVGSTSASSYDRLSVILSDMARFVLCHRFGGIYLDADTILLRDWEELWGWRGAFAYRWSRLEKYNTAVLRMNRNSALGTFLFRTALKNGLDFHPMSVSQYTKDAYLEGLLLRLPDALFDSAWLNTEQYQRDRPPQPYFTEFSNFFETPSQSGAAPQALGIDGFFKGAYSYHFHNFWWKPFDPARNFPDLGPRFAQGERKARESLTGETMTKLPTLEEERIEDDKRDLDWSTVIKRTFEAYIRGERPNMYGEWIKW